MAEYQQKLALFQICSALPNEFQPNCLRTAKTILYCIISQQLLDKSKLLLQIALISTIVYAMRTQYFNANPCKDSYQSNASGFNKKSVSEIVRIPSLSCQGTTGAFCIKIRLNPSPILRNDCVSCWRFSPVGISKAD